jgi:hypothetical protein
MAISKPPRGRYVKILDKEDPKGADVMSAIFGEVA